MKRELTPAQRIGLTKRWPPKTLQEKFDERVFYSPDGCWYWTGDVYTGWKNNDGKRARLKINKRQTSASRIAYQLYKGPIPEGLFVCHTCDNPLCVNPDHLWVGTSGDNMRDMVRKNRNRNKYTKPLNSKGV